MHARNYGGEGGSMGSIKAFPGMGGAVGMDGTAVALPSWRVVWQSNVLPYHVLTIIYWQ